MKKNIDKNRSIRLTQEMENFVEALEGKSFNDKFKKMINVYMKTLPKLNNEIEEKEIKLKTLNKKIENRINIMYNLNDILRTKEDFENKLKKIIEEEENIC